MKPFRRGEVETLERLQRAIDRLWLQHIEQRAPHPRPDEAHVSALRPGGRPELSGDAERSGG